MAPPVPPTEEGESSSVAPQGGAAASGDGQQNGPRSWERPWTLEEMRSEAGNWSLAGDAGLLHMLKEFSQRMIVRTHEMEKEVDGLVHEAKLTGVRLNNVTNEFIMLANSQFVENRVYDEDITQQPEAEDEKKAEHTEKTREQREADLIPKVSEALTFGINVIDQAFEKLDTHVADSDSEDEDAGYKVDPILEPKDPYVTRPLPCLIGSTVFLQDDNVGLVEDVSDEEAETDHGSISESEDEKKEEESETEYSDSEDERAKPSTAKAKRIKDSDQSESETESEESESDEDMFASSSKKKKVSDDEDDNDDDDDGENDEEDEEESEEEKGEEESSEKDVSRAPGGGDFASELAARIGAAIPKPQARPADEEEDGDERGEEESRPPASNAPLLTFN